MICSMTELQTPDFWERLEALLAVHKLVIDRPKGSAHPRYGEVTYPLDYGYLEDTVGGDGHGIDVWRGSLPDFQLVGVACTVDSHKRDAELKLLVSCSEDELEIINSFHNGNSMAAVIVQR
jgi:inorganic pyrophosphatase